MRSDTTTGGGKADHEVVNTPVRNERYLLEQLAHRRQVLVDVMNKQGPVAFG
jgi:hypothetical protein